MKLFDLDWLIKDILIMKIEKLIKDFDPITLIEFKNYLIDNLSDYCSQKNSNASILSTYSDGNKCCSECGCLLYKNGKTKNGIQKYICSGCKKNLSETTGTITYHSKLSFDIWSNVIDNLINGFSIRRIAEENNISILTSFRLRHKILLALKTFINKIELKGSVQSDEKYFSINLKGTKTNNMPRFSKKRTSNSSYNGISHHKVCVVSTIDGEDNLILRIAGLGRCTTNMLESSIGSKLKNVDILISDSASAYQKLCSNHNIKLQAVPSGFHSNGIINIAEINGVHSQLETWLSKFRGVSIRHLQEYLDWFVYIFIMKKRFLLNKLKIESYHNVILDKNYIKSNNICSIDIPINLNIAYAEYLNQSLS